MEDLIKLDDIRERMITLHGQPVLMDRDVALLYDVETREVNQALSNNPEKFPHGYIISLSYDDKSEVIKKFDHLRSLKFSPALPNAFTEKGLYMLATILRGQRATQATIAIIETFTNLRELSRTMAELAEGPDEKVRKSLMKKSGELLAEIFDNTMKTTGTETTIELNLAMMKVKHTVKKETEK